MIFIFDINQNILTAKIIVQIKILIRQIFQQHLKL